MDTKFPPYPPFLPESGRRRHSPLGIASFILSFLTVLLMCILYLFLHYFGGNSNMISSHSISVIGWVLAGGIGISNLAGISLGIAAVAQKTQRKILGIFGLVFNLLIPLGLCASVLLAVYLRQYIY
jgi:hypothetical protein